MGEIAQDYLEGRCCSGCAHYFDFPDDPIWEDGHGYPVMCEECWEEYPKQDVTWEVVGGEKVGITKDGVQKAIFN